MAKRTEVPPPDPRAGLELLRRKGDWSRRKLRLFAAACCRRLWRLLDPSSLAALLTFEQAVASVRTQRDWSKVQEPLQSAWEAVSANEPPRRKTNDPVRLAAVAAWAVVRGDPGDAAQRAADAAEAATPNSAVAEARAQVELLIDVFGNPLRAWGLEESHRPPQVISLAEAAYEHRGLPDGLLETARLAVLADALEDTGCRDWDLLSHLRGPGPHVLGCWAVDCVLGRE